LPVNRHVSLLPSTQLDAKEKENAFNKKIRKLFPFLKTFERGLIAGASRKTEIESSAQAAEALRPVAGDFAFILLPLVSSAPACWRCQCSQAPPPTRGAVVRRLADP
jgi:hypothetical protein